jgi:hypothetical protein
MRRFRLERYEVCWAGRAFSGDGEDMQVWDLWSRRVRRLPTEELDEWDWGREWWDTVVGIHENRP